jgi:hypothetical protein
MVPFGRSSPALRVLSEYVAAEEGWRPWRDSVGCSLPPEPGGAEAMGPPSERGPVTPSCCAPVSSPSPTTALFDEYELIKYARTTTPPRTRAKRVLCEVFILLFISKDRQKTKMKKHPMADPVAFLTSPEVQSFFEQKILKPILSKVVAYLYPYLLAFTCLWVIMFVCMIVILMVLMRARI